MDAILAALPQLAGLIEKGGIVGVLLIIIGGLVYEILRGRKHVHALRTQLAAVYSQRDTALLSVVKLKTICESKGIPVDLRDVQDMLPAPPALTTTS